MTTSQAVVTPMVSVPAATPRHSQSVLARYSGSTVAARCAHTAEVPPSNTWAITLATGIPTSRATQSAIRTSGEAAEVFMSSRL